MTKKINHMQIYLSLKKSDIPDIIECPIFLLLAVAFQIIFIR
ncbi:MAG: hypothetical protein K0R00_1591 [Herbinix sp.]|jgi:hypothetical protein|nr:hypothetical protein [Herbinix sp.]